MDKQINENMTNGTSYSTPFKREVFIYKAMNTKAINGKQPIQSILFILL